VIAKVYVVHVGLRPFPARLRDTLTPSKLRTNPQLLECDRIFPFELIVIKPADITLQVVLLKILDRILSKVLCYYKLRTLATLGPELSYAIEVQLPLTLPVFLPS